MAEHKERENRASNRKLDFSLVSVWMNQNTLDTVLLPCFSACWTERILIQGGSDFSIAEAYNRAVKEARSDIVIFSHPDVEFSQDGLSNVVETIRQHSVGAVGLVGVTGPQKQVWSSSMRGTTEVQTLDSCFIAIDRRKPFRFDHDTFDELHLHVEDFCCLVRSAGLRCVVVDSKKFNHHSETWKVRGCNWGKYPTYREKLRTKWGDVATT